MEHKCLDIFIIECIYLPLLRVNRNLCLRKIEFYSILNTLEQKIWFRNNKRSSSMVQRNVYLRAKCFLKSLTDSADE